MTKIEALTFVRKHGVVLEAARGPAPSLVDAIAGEAVRGSWWSHPKSQEIFAITRAIRDHPDILVCRLVEGKVTFVHRRLWPMLARLASRIPARRIARVVELHSESGRHETREVPFFDWVSRDVLVSAEKISEDAARVELGAWIGT